MITIVDGDLLTAKEDIIGHQVNCKGVMGSGVALQIKKNYPEVFRIYKAYCLSDGDRLLGKVLAISENNKIIFNMFGQNGYGRDKQYTDLVALEECIKKLWLYANERSLSVALPYNIGCGRGGAEWNKVYGLLCKHFCETGGSTNLVLYKY